MKIDLLLNYPGKIKEVSEMVYKEFVVETGISMSLEEVINYFFEYERKGISNNAYCLRKRSVF